MLFPRKRIELGCDYLRHSSARSHILMLARVNSVFSETCDRDFQGRGAINGWVLAARRFCISNSVLGKFKTAEEGQTRTFQFATRRSTTSNISHNRTKFLLLLRSANRSFDTIRALEGPSWPHLLRNPTQATQGRRAAHSNHLAARSANLAKHSAAPAPHPHLQRRSFSTSNREHGTYRRASSVTNGRLFPREHSTTSASCSKKRSARSFLADETKHIDSRRRWCWNTLCRG